MKFSQVKLPATALGLQRKPTGPLKLPLTFYNKLATILGLNTKTAVRNRHCYHLYHKCLENVSLRIPELHSAGLPDTMQVWFSLTTLHTWMAIVRLRSMDLSLEPKNHIQQFAALFFNDCEERMVNVGLTKGSLVNSALKDFLAQFYGSMLAYDESVFHSDAMLGAAIWRNVFQGSDVEPELVFKYVMIVRKNLQSLDNTSDEKVSRGEFDFIH